jgi:hypothetical protein
MYIFHKKVVAWDITLAYLRSLVQDLWNPQQIFVYKTIMQVIRKFSVYDAQEFGGISCHIHELEICGPWPVESRENLCSWKPYRRLSGSLIYGVRAKTSNLLQILARNLNVHQVKRVFELNNYVFPSSVMN